MEIGNVLVCLEPLKTLFTQTIVVPYLIPMLEKAGANVFTPRERDWQCNEVIVDNDDKYKYPYYVEVNNSKT